MAKREQIKIDESEEMFRPGTEEREIFSLALNLISELIVDKKVGIDFDSRGNLEFQFYFDPKTIKNKISTTFQEKLSFDDFMGIISTEIESLMRATCFPDKDKGIEDNIPSSIIKDVGIDEFYWRLDEVEKLIKVSKVQKQDFLFLNTSKGVTLKDIEWEIVNKAYDSRFGKISNLNYATLAILYSEPENVTKDARLVGPSFSIHLPVVREPKQLKLDLQKKDISKLIEELQQILERM